MSRTRLPTAAMRLNADRKQFPLTRTQVRLRHEVNSATDCAERGRLGLPQRMTARFSFEAALNAFLMNGLLFSFALTAVYRAEERSEAFLVAVLLSANTSEIERMLLARVSTNASCPLCAGRGGGRARSSQWMPPLGVRSDAALARGAPRPPTWSSGRACVAMLRHGRRD